MSKVRRAIIVTAAIVQTVRTMAASMPAGLGMFVAGYSPTGKGPATHYVSDGYIEEAFASAMSTPEALVVMLAEYGQTMSLAQASVLLSQSIVDEREASVVLAEMLLYPVSEDEA